MERVLDPTPYAAPKQVRPFQSPGISPNLLSRRWQAERLRGDVELAAGNNDPSDPEVDQP
jgi:hypothetical protein